MRYWVLALILMPLWLKAQKPAQYSKVTIFLSEQQSLQQLAQLGIPLEHAEVADNYAKVVVNDFDLWLLQGLGYDVSIDIPDLNTYYDNRTAIDLSAQSKNSEFLSCNDLFNDCLLYTSPSPRDS